jgi:hypothetical protein
MDLTPRIGSPNPCAGTGIGAVIGNFLGILLGNRMAKNAITKALNALQEEIKAKYNFSAFGVDRQNFTKELHAAVVAVIPEIRNSEGNPLTLLAIKTGQGFVPSQETDVRATQIYPMLSDLLAGYNSILNRFVNLSLSDPDIVNLRLSLTTNISYVEGLKKVLDDELLSAEYQFDGFTGED